MPRVLCPVLPLPTIWIPAGTLTPSPRCCHWQGWGAGRGALLDRAPQLALLLHLLIGRSGAATRVVPGSAVPPMTMALAMAMGVRRVGVRRHGGRVAAALSVLAIGLVRWQTLDDAVAGQHAAIHREVPADHEGTHCRVLSRQLVRFVRQIRLVLASVNQHKASVPASVPEHVVRRLFPSAPVAEPCGILR